MGCLPSASVTSTCSRAQLRVSGLPWVCWVAAKQPTFGHWPTPVRSNDPSMGNLMGPTDMMAPAVDTPCKTSPGSDAADKHTNSATVLQPISRLDNQYEEIESGQEPGKSTAARLPLISHGRRLTDGSVGNGNGHPGLSGAVHKSKGSPTMLGGAVAAATSRSPSLPVPKAGRGAMAGRRDPPLSVKPALTSVEEWTRPTRNIRRQRNSTDAGRSHPQDPNVYCRTRGDSRTLRHVPTALGFRTAAHDGGPMREGVGVTATWLHYPHASHSESMQVGL
jgi:hypothetical protein